MFYIVQGNIEIAIYGILSYFEKNARVASSRSNPGRIVKVNHMIPFFRFITKRACRFSHLIDVSIFYDLMNCLKAITSNRNITVHPLSIFHIIHTVSNLSVIHGAALMDLDLRYFHCLFYQTLLKMSNLDFLKKYFMESNGKKITELIIRNCHLLFWKRGESSVNRLASYCHALASLSTSINELVKKGSNGSIASDLDACSRNIIHILLSLIERQPKLSTLLADNDDEATFGSFAYSTAVNDPDLTNGFGKTLNLNLPSKSSSEWMSLASKVRKLSAAQ